jgi:hypothetical protein
MNNDVYDNLPTDTPRHILKKQAEIIQSLPYSERLRIACGLADFSYLQTMNMLRKKLNTNDEKLLKIAFVETVYKDDLSKEDLDRIRVLFSKK